MHCRYEFPSVTNPSLHVNMATFPSEIMYTLPLSGLLSVGHLLFSTQKGENWFCAAVHYDNATYIHIIAIDICNK